MSLLYLVWLGADQLYLALRRRRHPDWRLASLVMVSLLLLAGPWFIWALSRLGVEKVLVPTYTISENRLPLTTYLVSRVTILATTFFIPAPMIGAFLGRARIAPGVDALTYWGHPLLRTYLETFLGGFTFIGAAFMLTAWARNRSRCRDGLGPLLTWVLLGAATCLALHFLVDLKGQAFNIMGPLVTVSLVLMCRQVAADRSPVIRMMPVAVLFEYAAIRVLIYMLTLPAPKPAPYLFDIVRTAVPAAAGTVLVTAAICICALEYALITAKMGDDET